MGWGEVGYVTPLDTPAPNRALTLCKLLPALPGHIPRSRRTTAFPNQRPDTPARPSSFHVSTNLPAAYAAPFWMPGAGQDTASLHASHTPGPSGAERAGVRAGKAGPPFPRAPTGLGIRRLQSGP